MIRDNNYENRYEYPFISVKGDLSVVIRAVDDLTLWLNPGVVWPIQVSVAIDGSELVMSFTDKERTMSLTAKNTSGLVLDQHGSLRGLISWNSDMCTSLYATLKSNDPQPDGELHVDPRVCTCHDDYAYSSVYINGEIVTSGIIELPVDPTGGIRPTHTNKGSVHLDIYDPNSLGNSNNIRNIKVEDVTTYKSNGDVEVKDVTISDINGDVWLLSDPECDIRVVTEDSITITEISNDKL